MCVCVCVCVCVRHCCFNLYTASLIFKIASMDFPDLSLSLSLSLSRHSSLSSIASGRSSRQYSVSIKSYCM